ncbi:MAG TPA: tetratricopeptide repeat protein [Bryobacteraceae bacterium]|nr:tetratricopeptide repeat protein [Bryobacteraceae bacterium]
MPFFNTTGSNNLEWVGESICQTIREALASEGVLTLDRQAREEGFRRLSVKPYTVLTKATVMRMGESLDADQVIFGSFQVTAPEGQDRSKGTIRIHAQAIDLRKARRGPEYSDHGPLDDLARLQSRIAWQTMEFVLADRRPTEQQFRQRLPVIRLDALESYVRGTLAGAADQKLKYFTQAIRLDPNYSRANFEIGRLHFERRAYRPAAEALQKVPTTDVRYREATFLLGLCRYYLADFAASERAFQTVAQQVPLNEVINNLGAAQSRLNQTAVALENFKKAMEGDPADPAYHFNVGYALLHQGDLDAAAERFRAVLARNPDDAEATTMLGRCLRKSAAKAPVRSEGFERLKENYQESAYWQLKAVLEPKR